MRERGAVRVAIHCPYSISVPGGVQGQVLGLSRELRKLGHSVSVLAPVDDAVNDPSDEPGVVSLGRSLGWSSNGAVAPVALGPRATVRALRTLRAQRFDVLHVHEPFAPGASYACVLSAGMAKVGTFHRSGPSIFYRVLRPGEAILARRMQVMCAVSEAARETALRGARGHYEIVGNGVDVERFALAEPQRTRGPTIMFVGRHEERKGLEVLLSAFGDLGRSDAVLWVAGHGRETATLEARYPGGDRIEWLGRIDDAEVARRLRGAQIACFPSTGGESFGVVLLEAMAARCVTVASDIPAYRSVAGGHASLVSPGDSGALRRALVTAIGDVTRAGGRASAAALEAAASYASGFSMAAMAARYEAIYEEAIRAYSDSRRRSAR